MAGLGGRVMVAATTAVVALLGVAPAAVAGPGDLDGTFGDGGLRSCGAGEGSDVLVERERIVMVGAAPGADGTDVLVCRVTASGELDTSFGGDGVVTTTVVPGAGNASAGAVTPAWRARILVAGVADAAPGPDVAPHAFVARYLRDGALDPSFAGDGVQTVPLPGALRVLAMRLSGKGRITVAVRVGSAAREDDVALVRLLYGGSRDRSFDGDGIRNVAIPIEPFFEPRAAAFSRGGQLVIAGEAPVESESPAAPLSAFGAVRLTAEGHLDPAFGTGGAQIVTLPFQSDLAFANGVAVGPDDSVLLGGLAQTGANSNDTAVVRLTARGAPDPTFGLGGTVQTGVAPPSTEFIPPEDRALDIAVMPDGRIVAGGFAVNFLPGETPQATVLRYRRDGALDPTFGNGGISLLPLPSAEEVAIDRFGAVFVRSGSTLARLTGDSADLRLGGSVTVSAGQLALLTYTLTIRNDGPQPAPGVVLTNVLPTGATSQDARAARGQCYYQPPDRVRCILGTMAPGEQETVTLRAFAPLDAGTVVARPSVSSGAADPDIADNARRFTTTLPGS